LWLVAADVPESRYAASAIEAALDDLKWVSRCAVAHESVVEHFASARAILPMKLFTIFRSDARAIAEVQAIRPSLDRAIARLTGAAEWGVRLVGGVGKIASPRPARMPASGAGFLHQKRIARDAGRMAAAHASATADTVFDELSRVARESRRRDAQSLAAGPAVLLEAAFLVARKDRRRFQQSIGRLARQARAQGYELSVTGPWPPYHFMDEPQVRPRRTSRARKPAARARHA
jgi:hypothetical protein